MSTTVETNPAGVVVRADRSFAELLGLGPAALVGRDLASVLGVALVGEVELRREGRLLRLAREPRFDEGGSVVYTLRETSAEEALARAEAVQRRIAFVHAVSGMLLEHARDRDRTVRTLASALVPHLGDWCLVHLVRQRRAERVAHAHWAPERAALGGTLPPVVELAPAPNGLGRVVATGQPEVVALGASPGEPLAPDTRLLVERLGARSWLIVPLAVGGRILATLTLVAAESLRSYGHDELELTTDLALRAASALDNALLFEETRRAVEVREDLMSMVSHDLKSPLSVMTLVSARLDAFLAHEPAPSEHVLRARELVPRLRSAHDRMRRLVEDLLDVSRIEAGKLVLRRRPTSALGVVVRAVEPLEPLAADRSIRLAIDLPRDLPPLDADEDRLVQVVANLASNAIKFTPIGGKVAVSGRRRGERVELAISDDGPGIPSEQLSRLFARFARSQHPKAEGHGLGLFIAKGIVDAHGGDIRVESAVGQGATFTFSVPIVPS